MRFEFLPTPSSPSSKEIDKTLKKRIKKIIHERGIAQTTRKGSKELSKLTRRIAQEPFESLEAVNQLGERLGAKIAEATEQRGSDRLFQETIRQLVLKGTVQALVTASTDTVSPREEAALDTAALRAEVEVSGEPEANLPQAAQLSQTAQESQAEDPQLSSTALTPEDAAEASPEEASESLHSEPEADEKEEGL